ncbi:MAG: 50S ribosomal protein L15 [Candidatus Omnitrophica bacterium]|nr:50S ribosomal protein L15 [Candidatus Omnitrophota bacterium]
MYLHELKSPKGAHKRRKIVGRGRGSGHGKTSGRGQTGQHARAGRAILFSLEGGQMHLIRRLPKVGFNSRRPMDYQIVPLNELNKFKDGAVVTVQTLKEQKLIKSVRRPVKILNAGDISKRLTIQVQAFSKSAQEKITKAGGKAEVVVLNPVKS